ncbi:cyanophycin synthetase [Natranaerobius thermophilus]|uniref:Cyanophycin synthetase n=1 Tax=Natranaerobius thermophilus (strain ATCC BAA-1301 / DSM 18059 / JW/NM-WN-LF) TaxID=457570 RepID=B2A3M8_NATTJ|nr:cyanophycin synthetase [Natranaerobius thermophilus]ACB83654.1 cyanophycin synthetase [Natranaerobius thermophilus JW/NM-WN-LF]
MEIINIKTISGKNIYSHEPVLEAELDLGDFAGVFSNNVSCFNSRLHQILPSLQEHVCSRGYPGGFLERLEEGTLFGHIIEHVTLELMNLAGIGTNYGTTKATQEDGIYQVIVEQINEEGAKYALEQSVELVKNVINDNPVQVEEIVSEIQEIVNETKIGPSTEAILSAAEEQEIPYLKLDEASMYQLGTGKYQKRIQATVTDETSVIGVDIACDKTKTNNSLHELGLPVPYGKIASTEEEAVAIVQEIGYPIVIKPRDGNQGKGVTLNINSEQETRSAFKVAMSYGDEAIVEQHIEGKHYRLVVVGDQLVAGAERIPAHVVGDGQHTIRELVDIENQNPLRGFGHEKPLSKIQLDPVVNMVLARKNMTMNYIPQQDELVYLRESANLSTGGISLDVTDEISDKTIRIAIRVAKIVGLDIAGVDLVAKDIGKPVDEDDNGAIIEVNAAPGIRMHEHPVKGHPRRVGKSIVDHLFNKRNDTLQARAPVISVTGTNGKTTTVRAIDHILRSNGKDVGMTSSDGTFIKGELIDSGDNTGPNSAKALLKDPTIDSFVFETARGGLVKNGLGYSNAKVAVVTNIANDHLGQDGIESIDDLIFVKSLVVEAVEKQGVVVLNASDHYVSDFIRKAKGRIIFYAMESDNHYVKSHLAAGGSALYLDQDNIVYATGKFHRKLGEITQLPLTMAGMARHNIENCMAGIAAAIGFGIAPSKAFEVLKQFAPSYQDTPGRCNLFRCQGKTVLLDYGHNPEGMNRVLAMVEKMPVEKVISVIGVPGDRNDKLIKETGKVVGKYHELIEKVLVKEDSDLRGRKSGETANLLQTTMTEFSEELAVEQNLQEIEAIKTALSEAGENDLVLIFYEQKDSFFNASEELGLSPEPLDFNKLASQSNNPVSQKLN